MTIHLKSNRPLAGSLLSICERYRFPIILTRRALHPFTGRRFPALAFHRWSRSSHRSDYILSIQLGQVGENLAQVFLNSGIVNLEWGRALAPSRTVGTGLVWFFGKMTGNRVG